MDINNWIILAIIIIIYTFWVVSIFVNKELDEYSILAVILVLIILMLIVFYITACDHNPINAIIYLVVFAILFTAAYYVEIVCCTRK